MKLDRYELKSDDQLTTFDFLSEGPKGKIEKVVQFTLIYQDNLYNLAFGDRKIFEINSDGIKIENQMTICWTNIYEIETRKYPGPRMSFYRIKLIKDYDKTQKKSIWLSSDTEPDWT